jgi:hypothetical protein
MNNFVFDSHSDTCFNQKNRLKGTGMESWGSVCENNPHHFLFFVGVEFYLLTYFGCMKEGHHLDFKRDIVKKVLGTCKDLPMYEVTNEALCKDRFAEFRLRGTPLQKTMRQVNYIYHDATGLQYAITTKTPFIQSFFNKELVIENGEKAMEFLKREQLNYLCDELESLIKANTKWLDKSDAVIIQTIDQITKHINNHDTKKGKHKGTLTPCI